MNYTTINKEIETLDLQMIISFIFILTIITSIILTYNQDYYLRYGKRLIDTDKAIAITKINRIIIIILLISFLYINYEFKEVDALKGNDLTADNLQIIASYLSIIAGLIILYVVFEYGQENLTTTENPNI